MKVVDGNRNYLLLEEEFIELYNNREISIKKICKRLKISYSEYRKLRDKCNSEGTIELRPYHRSKKPKRVPKNYSPVNRGIHGESYCVRHCQDYFGIYGTILEAELIVKKLKECEWDKSQLDRIRKEVKELIK